MKYEQRLKMVQYAAEFGVKAAARHFGVSVRIVRKWFRRWKEDNYSRASLMDRSRAPKTCPHKTKAKTEKAIVEARQQAPCMGPVRLKDSYELDVGLSAIARVLRSHGLTSRRRKKHETKRNLLEIKARLAAMEQVQVDVKYLTDLPYYITQMAKNPELPKFQYTARDVKTGGVFLGFAEELSEAHACCFVAAVASHLERVDFSLKDRIVQTDNGSEFSGAERKSRNDRGFTATVQEYIKARHRFIPPGKKNHQADVESLHWMIEREFFDLEHFDSRAEFFLKASAWQLWCNTTRINYYKGRRTPDQIMLEERPLRDARVWMLPALDLDQLLSAHVASAVREEGKGGYYVPPLPASGGGFALVAFVLLASRLREIRERRSWQD